MDDACDTLKGAVTEVCSPNGSPVRMGIAIEYSESPDTTTEASILDPEEVEELESSLESALGGTVDVSHVEISTSLSGWRLFVLSGSSGFGERKLRNLSGKASSIAQSDFGIESEMQSWAVECGPVNVEDMEAALF